VLQTFGSTESFGSGESAFSSDYGSGLNLGYLLDLFKRRFFCFLFPFGLVATAGLCFAAIQKPNYLSEGKILAEAQAIAPDIVKPVITATASERVQLIQQRVMTRDNLLSVASKFGLFPGRTGVPDLMRESLQIKPVEVEGQPRYGVPALTVAFTVGFEYDNPEIAMRVADEFVTLLLSEDARSRTSRSSEAVRILIGETKDIEDKLEATQIKLFQAQSRPREALDQAPDQQKSELTALAAMKAELAQKLSVYSESHPALVAMKKRIALMEKNLTQPAQTQATQPTSGPTDNIDSLKQQREDLEKRLIEANAKLATARLSEKLDQDQQSDRLQVIEAPTLPQNPLKSNRLKLVGLAFAAAIALGAGAMIAVEFLDGSIRGRHQLAGVIPPSLIVSIPFMPTRGDVIRARLRIVFAALSVLLLLAILGALGAVIVFKVPLDPTFLNRSVTSLRWPSQ
jgi:hypothetical protein